MSLSAALRHAMHREPIITWSLLIGGVGLALPVVVPPVREFLGFGNVPVPKNPPPVKDMIAKAKA